MVAEAGRDQQIGLHHGVVGERDVERRQQYFKVRRRQDCRKARYRFPTGR